MQAFARSYEEDDALGNPYFRSTFSGSGSGHLDGEDDDEGDKPKHVLIMTALALPLGLIIIGLVGLIIQ